MARIYLLTAITILVLTYAIWNPTNAFFTDSSIASANTFTAANEFPQASASATPVPTGETTPTATPTTIPTPTSEVTPTATPSETVTPSPTPANIANHLVISEVQIAGALAGNDFVEIYNPTSNSVTITGWKLRFRTSGGTESSLGVIPTASIASHGYYLWASNDNGFATTVSADTSNGNNLTSDNSVALLTLTDIIVDQVGWGTGISPFIEGTAFIPNPIANQSIERKAQNSSTVTSMMSGVDVSRGNGYDTNNNTNDFILRTTSQPQNSGSAAETL